ncbi:MAG: BMP family ABC transporter substrate-binding protein [Fibromonadales bacterium]|nr:BMP family ABC transporter substrate-binding protein [Fibromonadales bacterium]
MSKLLNFTLLLLFMSISGCKEDKSLSWSIGSPLDKNLIKIGIIYVDKAESGYSQAHDLGIKEAQLKLNLRDDQIIRIFDVSDADSTLIEHNMNEAIKEGANIIVATSWGQMDACEKLSKKYTNVIFTHASGYKINDRNFTNYFGRIYQARYLSGIVAGLKTKTGKIGFVAAQGKSNSEVTGGLDAFAMGVESVNPGAKIYVNVTYSWFDPPSEKLATQRLIKEGSDVIAQHSNTAIPQIEAEKAGVWSVGYNTDMRRYAPNAVLTSVIWNWGIYYTSLISNVIDGSFTTKPYFGGLEDGLVDISPLNKALATPDMESAVADAKKRILTENFKVFGSLSDFDIAQKINWYHSNIIELK